MSYNTWFAYRLCNGHAGKAGKWSVGFQKGPREEIYTAKRASGGSVAYGEKVRAESLALHLNENNVKPGEENA